MLDIAHPAEPQIGHNNPPDPTLYEQSRDEIEDLFMEAKNWLDGEPVETQGQADAISLLIDKLRKAEKVADDRRKVEAKPFDDGKAEVQARYNPLIQEKKGKTFLAIDTCKKALAPFLKKIDDENRRMAAEAAAEAERMRLAAVEAVRAASLAETDLTAKQDAEWLVQQAKDAESHAKFAAKEKAAAKGGSRAIGLRTVYRHEIENETELARYMWKVHRSELLGFLNSYTAGLVRSGIRTIPGVKVIEEQVAQ